MKSETIKALRGLKVHTGSLQCMGCGYEHNCGVHGCAIIRQALQEAEQDAAETAALRSQVEQLTNGQVQQMKAFQATVDGLTVERDAAVAELFNFTSAQCFICKHEGHKWLSDGKMDDLCRTCIDNYKCNWEWRGQQKEA